MSKDSRSLEAQPTLQDMRHPIVHLMRRPRGHHHRGHHPQVRLLCRATAQEVTMALLPGPLRFSIENPVARDTPAKRIIRRTTITKVMGKGGNKVIRRILVARL